MEGWGKTRRAFLGMPSHGLVSHMAAAGFWNATRWVDSIIRKPAEGSLLGQNFNALWCTALNIQHIGHQLDYFAMQHADVEPARNWLDTLIEEMETHNLDIIGAAVPIKDTRGLTSIALHREGDNWNPLCRLSVHEIKNLPETFTSEDVGHKILLNTGLWVCRFDAPWRKQVHFTINDKIVFDQRAGSYKAYTESEDWFFSRLCHEIGLRVGATRKVPLMHRGEMLFSSEETWGAEFDTLHVHESQVRPQDGFRFPHDIDGWLTEREGRSLYEIAKGKRVLEIGSYCGKSTICLAQSAEHVTSVDPHDSRGIDPNRCASRNTFEDLTANLNKYGVSDKVTARICTANEYVTQPVRGFFDVIFIDGAHDYDSVKSDIEDASLMLTDGGELVFHDYHSAADPDVTRAVDELVAGGGKLLSTNHTLAVVRPLAAFPLEV
jgi:precorrin-6B methylase 2